MINNVIEQLSKELNISKKIILNTYKGYWLFIKNQIESLPLKDNINEEDFSNLKVSFNIPKLGKFYITYKDYLGIKKKYNTFIKHVENKKD